VTVSQPRPSANAPDLELLRHYEPVVRFTRGESFFPASVATYVRSSAHIRREAGIEQVLASPGDLTEHDLVSDPGAPTTTQEYITVAGVSDPSSLAELLPLVRNQAIGFRRGGGRLTRVGYASRLVDALFSLSLLARGRVPGSLARRAVHAYRPLAHGEHPYYGRVIRSESWIVLQYWLFYTFNDWRSGFNGANDHEADWEQVLVYLYRDDDGLAVPRWVAYAQHDYDGRDLRRRWDDRAELELVDDHPVVYAAAGSHASYFRGGEYLTEQELRLPAIVRGILNTFSRLMHGARPGRRERILPIAFVDYARGDGVSIGPGADRPWTPVVLDSSQQWVSAYRGLWGVSVQDPFEGEDAPAGPMFNRDGTVRRSWLDPVGFADLDSVPPPSQELTLLSEREAALVARQRELDETIPAVERRSAAAGAEHPNVPSSRASTTARELDALQAELVPLYEERAENLLRLGALRHRREALARGEDDPPQSHLRKIPVPAAVGASRSGFLLEAWAAMSVGLLLLALVGILVLAPGLGVAAALVVIAGFIFVESILQSRVVALLATWTRLLALVASIVLVVTFWQPVVIAIAIAAALFVLRENIVELIPAPSEPPEERDAGRP
jgi:hypothetical protein